MLWWAMALVLVHGASADEQGLTVQLFDNSVMRGTPHCTKVLHNGFHLNTDSFCGGALSGRDASLGTMSLRITGTLTVPEGAGTASAVLSGEWYAFAITVGTQHWVRLWVDDHRLVDQWSGPHDPTPVTHALLPNVTLSASRPVFLRADMRLFSSDVNVTVLWRNDPHAPPSPVPPSTLRPVIPDTQQLRWTLQDNAARGWNHWYRKSFLALVALPQQVGIDLGIRDRRSMTEFRNALLKPQFPHRGNPPVPVRLGYHLYDGSFSEMHFVPFPDGTEATTSASAVNFTVQTAALPSHTAPLVFPSLSDHYVVVRTNLSSGEGAQAANLSVTVHPMVLWGAYANVSVSIAGAAVSFDTEGLGTVTAVFSRAPIGTTPDNGLEFTVTDEPLVALLTFGSVPPGGGVDVATALHAVTTKRAEAAKLIASAVAAVGVPKMTDAYDAIMTSIAWNVNFDPRVSVTVPVSRTFEGNFDFLFFDWDCYFLSLMACTRPVALDDVAFDIGVSNLIEVTQTRSAYGQVMNKRAASGSSSSDTNDRSEPYVGAGVVKRIYDDALASGSSHRKATMAWVVRLLFPSLLGWNQWVWNLRRYNVSNTKEGGLVVLGADNHLPCEGSTVGLNSSRTVCASDYGAILESGMDNSPMYYDTFDVPGSSKRAPARWDAEQGRVQLYDCQQSALFVAESQALQALAAVAGRSDTMPMLQHQSQTLSRLINNVLWDDATGVYRQKDASPLRLGFSPAISPTSFYPMIAGIPSQAQATRLLHDHLLNASEFCVSATKKLNGNNDGMGATTLLSADTLANHASDVPTTANTTNSTATTTTECPFAIPSISRSDPNFYDNSYWRGRTWGPVNLLTWLGLSAPQYGNVSGIAAAREGLARQSLDLVMGEWLSVRHVHENYNSTTGKGGDVINSNPFYTWGSNLAYIAIREAMRLVNS
eukprot:m.169852 g.169852  ORF g.169852 m.169852 type:complete len:934 (+) comp17815_c0_seq5:96-2897(+)